MIRPNSRLPLSIPFSLSQPIFCIPTYISFHLLSIHLYFFIPHGQSILMPISFYLFINSNSRLYHSNPFSLSHVIHCISTCIWFYLLSIDFYHILSLSQIIFTPISFNPVFFILIYFLYTHIYWFRSLVYPPLFLYTSLRIQIDAYLFLSLCQSKFTAISFKPVFFISLYSLYINLYLFLSLVYRLLFLYISFSIQIDVYLFLHHFFISAYSSLSTGIYFYFFSTHHSIFLSIFYPN